MHNPAPILRADDLQSDLPLHLFLEVPTFSMSVMLFIKGKHVSALLLKRPSNWGDAGV